MTLEFDINEISKHHALFSAFCTIFRPSAVAQANLLQNSLPTRGLGKYTTYDFFFSENVFVSFIYVYSPRLL
jgi:hypothetical protein